MQSILFSLYHKLIIILFRTGMFCINTLSSTLMYVHILISICLKYVGHREMAWYPVCLMQMVTCLFSRPIYKYASRAHVGVAVEVTLLNQ